MLRRKCMCCEKWIWFWQKGFKLVFARCSDCEFVESSEGRILMRNKSTGLYKESIFLGKRGGRFL